jgi:glycosyltransferase involved in cell wall biosynthesis
MILAQTLAYQQDGGVLDPPVHRGPEIADSELTAASLAYDAAEGVHFFLGQPPPRSIEALSRRFGARVSVRTVTDWPASARAHEYVLSARPTSLDAFARARAIAGEHHGLFTLLDRVPNPQWIVRFASLLLFAREQDAVVVPSAAACGAVQGMIDHAADLLRDRIGARVTRRVRVLSLPLGIGDEAFVPRDREWCRDVLDLPRRARILLVVGRLSEAYKADLDPLLTILARLRTKHPDLFLLIAGRDSAEQMAARLQHHIAASGLAAHARVWPGFHAALKPLLYGAADIFIAPADNIQEAFGLSVAEAAASGLPIVASDWAGHREQIRHRETGWLVPTAWSPAAGKHARTLMPIGTGFVEHYAAQRTVVDVEAWTAAIETLLADDALRQALGVRARAAADVTWRWSRAIGAYGELWREQAEIARAASSASASTADGWRLDYTRAFTHFATATWTAADRVSCAAAGRSWLDARARKMASGDLAPPPFPAADARGIDADAAARLLTRCAERPLPLADLIGREAGADRLVWWLLKKGFAERAAEPVEGPTDDARTDLSVPASEEPVLGR